MLDLTPTYALIPLDGSPEIPVGSTCLILGRDPACGIWLGSPRVSRRHCLLLESAGLILVRDLGSTNGTRINGRRVVRGWLTPGDVLKVAHLGFLLIRRGVGHPTP